MAYLLAVNNQPSRYFYTMVVCAVAFWIFSFTYLYDYQADILAAGQHVLSEGQTHYGKLVGALLITLFLFLLQVYVAKITRLKKRAYSLNYFPSLLLLTIITDVSSEIDLGFSFGGWIIAFPLLLIIFAGLVWVLRQMEPFEPESASNGWFSRNTWINMLTMVAMFLGVGLFSNGDEVFHYRMKIEKLLLEEKYEEALKVGKKSLATDPSLTMLRAHILAKEQQLGNRFFHYPVAGSSKTLIPDSINSRTILLPDSIIKLYARQPSVKREYQLTGMLLDKKINSFAEAIVNYYPDTIEQRHYAEALVFQLYYSGKPMSSHVDNIVETDFHDFRELEKVHLGSSASNMLRRTFGNTYWYYYKYVGK